MTTKGRENRRLILRRCCGVQTERDMESVLTPRNGGGYVSTTQLLWRPNGARHGICADITQRVWRRRGAEHKHIHSTCRAPPPTPARGLPRTRLTISQNVPHVQGNVVDCRICADLVASKGGAKKQRNALTLRNGCGDQGKREQKK